MTTNDSSVLEPDYVAQMQLSIDLLDASRRCHNAEMAVARCQAAIEAYPNALVWRYALNSAAAMREDERMCYDDLTSRVRWAEWGLIDESGP